MKKLTNEQILLILTLSERCDSITGSSIANSDGSVFVDIHSVDNASLDQHIENCEAIEEVFPGGTMISMGILNNRADGSTSQNFRVAGSTSACVTFYTKKKPLLQTEAVEEINHLDCTVNVTKVQSLLEPWYVEQILRDGGGMK